MPQALSVARALGIWQFIRSTGLRYDLNQDKYVDERRDPYKATQSGHSVSHRPSRPFRRLDDGLGRL